MNRFVTPTRVGVVLAGAALAAVAVWAAAGRLPSSKSNSVAAAPAATPVCAHGTRTAECDAAMKQAESVGCPACPACPEAPAKPTSTAATAERSAKAKTMSAGMVVGIDPETGALGMPSAGQAAALRAMDEASANESQGVLEVRHADGSVSVTDVSGRFQEHMLVKVGPDGKLQKVCVDASRKDATLKKAPAPAPKPLEEK